MNIFDNITPLDGGGPELSCAVKVWTSLALCEARLEFLNRLVSFSLGLREIQELTENSTSKFRSEKFKLNKEKESVKLGKEHMILKIRDEKAFHAEKLTEKNEMRRKLVRKTGENTRRTRTIIKILRTEAMRQKTLARDRYDKKLRFLREKYRGENIDEMEKTPEGLENYGNAKIFSRLKYEKLERQDPTICVVGDLEISEEERQALSLPPKYGIMAKLLEIDFENDLEIGLAKLRYQLLQELGEELSPEDEDILRTEMTETDRDNLEEESTRAEAEARAVFDPLKKVYDNRNKRVTDLKENSRVHLPRPLPPGEEANIEMRRGVYMRLFQDFVRNNCKKNGDQKTNITREIDNGIKSLKKRIDNEEIIIMETDKSGKLAITSRETYLKLGDAHTAGDRLVSSQEIREIEKQLNGHSSMWIKMTGMAERHGQESRTRESKISRSQNIARMRLLLKDHKKKLCTRPVVSGCDSHTLGLSNMVSDLLEAVCNSVDDPFEVISTEDMLARIRECNEKLKSTRDEKIMRGEIIPDTEEDIIMFGSDVVALFPSLSASTTGLIVRRQIEKSPTEFAGIDYQQVSLYIALNRDKTGPLGNLEKFMPFRTSNRGVAPGMKNPVINKKEKNTTTTWTYPKTTPSKAQEKMLVARMAEIGVRTLFTNFCYSFGGHDYLQQAGGPIGMRLTMAASRLVMHDWAEQYQQKLMDAGLDILLLSFYVDDNRQATTPLPMGVRYETETGKFEYRDAWKIEDEDLSISGTERMMRECIKAMNSINQDLTFTVEWAGEFDNSRLPTLDFSMWIEQGLICHTYYEKEMRNQILVMRDSSMAERQKMDILSNGLVRRLSNVGNNIGQCEKDRIIDHFTQQLVNSGFERKQVYEIISSGLKGYENKIERRKRARENFYRKGVETLEERTRKKLTEKTSWFKKKKRKEILKFKKNSQKNKNREKYETGAETEGAKAVITVPHTHCGLLARLMRLKEEELFKLTGYKLKITERVGPSLKSQLVRSDPWAGRDCDREDCLLCVSKIKSGKKSNQSCKKRNAVYETWCESCRVRDEKNENEKEDNENDKNENEKDKNETKIYKYIGETCRSSYERGSEHLADMRTIKPGSHLLKHVLDQHEGETLEEVDFRMRVVKYHKSPFERQIHESVLIRASIFHHLLNSKVEYNRCQIPRIAIKMGEKEVKERKIEIDNEIENETKKDQDLEEKIKLLRKLINRKRAPRRPQKCEPDRKRIRIDHDGQIGNEIKGMRDRREALEREKIDEKKEEQSKRKEKLENSQIKKQCKSDIRNYLSKSNYSPSPEMSESTSKHTHPPPSQPTIPHPEHSTLSNSISATVPVRGEEGGGDSSQSPPPNEFSNKEDTNKKSTSTFMDPKIPPQQVPNPNEEPMPISETVSVRGEFTSSRSNNKDKGEKSTGLETTIPPHSPIIRRVTHPSGRDRPNSALTSSKEGSAHLTPMRTPAPINKSPESTEISPSLSPPVHCRYCQAESIHECEEDKLIIPVTAKTAIYEHSQDEFLLQVIMSASKPVGGEGGGETQS